MASVVQRDYFHSYGPTSAPLFIDVRWFSVFRRRGESAPYRMWGYPLVPALFIATSALLLGYTFAQNLRNSAAGLLVILAGVPVFCAFSKKRIATEARRHRGK